MLRVISALVAGLLLCAQTPMLPGFPPGTFQSRAALDAAPAAGGPTLTYLGSIGDNGNSASTTLSLGSLDFGTAANTMIIVTYAGTASSASTVSGDIGGSPSLTLDVQKESTIFRGAAVLSHFYATGPGTGQTVNVTATNTAFQFRVVFVYKLVGAASSAVVQTGGFVKNSSATPTPASPTITVANNDFMFAPIFSANAPDPTGMSTAPTTTRTNATSGSTLATWEWSPIAAPPSPTTFALNDNNNDSAVAVATYK